MVLPWVLSACRTLPNGTALGTACLQGILLPYEIDGVLKSTHRPNYVLQVIKNCF
jgi:hypothetical protein